LKETVTNGKTPDEELIFSEIDYGIWNYRSGERYVMVTDGRYKLTLYRDPENPELFAGNDDQVLFDMAVDPYEKNNLARESAYSHIMDDLIAKLDVWDRSRTLVKPKLINNT
jgi:hypothetical protein